MKIYIFLLVQLIHLSALLSQNSKMIPAWVFDIKNYNNDQFAVGISDPDMDSITAFEQAKMRALINYGIFNNGQYGSLTSIAIGNEQENIYDATSIETILYSSLIKGNFKVSDSIQIEKKEFTKYNECCVLLKKCSSKIEQTSVFQYSLVRRTGFQKENNIFPVFIDELEFVVELNDSLKFTYFINRKNDKYDIRSNLGDTNNLKEISIKNIYRNYSSTSDSEKENNTTYYSKLSSGLWSAYMFELFDQISFNSILNKNKANQLITLEQGNINNKNIFSSLNELIFSSKKHETEPLKVQLDKINVQANYLKIKFKENGNQPAVGQVSNTNISQNIKLSRSDRKNQKKLIKEKWIALGFSDIKNAYSKLKYFENKEEYINSSAILETRNLGNGILKGLQIARTGIENQLKSKIKTMNKIEIEDNSNLSVQTSKTFISEKTEKIEPYFIFLRKINNSFYKLNIILFYKI
ncbi:MAG: hypothetical protein ABFS35_02705 [Bacteroidota bacterium]